MLLDLNNLYRRYNLDVKGVLHIGAHFGEEAEIYEALGIKHVWWVEANPDLIPRLRAHVEQYGHKVIKALVMEEGNGKVTLNITNLDGLSSSVLEFGTHTSFSPEIQFVERKVLEAWTVDALVSIYEIKGVNMLAMDIQGAELLALRGAKVFLGNVDVILTEVNSDEVYQGCARIWEIDEFLEPYGLTRKETHWVSGQGWGDALYTK